MKEGKLKSDIFIFNRENSQEQEQISCRDFLWGMFTSFLHKVVLQNNLNNFATLSSGSAAIQNPCIYRHHIF